MLRHNLGKIPVSRRVTLSTSGEGSASVHVKYLASCHTKIPKQLHFVPVNDENDIWMFQSTGDHPRGSLRFLEYFLTVL